MGAFHGLKQVVLATVKTGEGDAVVESFVAGRNLLVTFGEGQVENGPPATRQRRPGGGPCRRKRASGRLAGWRIREGWEWRSTDEGVSPNHAAPAGRLTR